MAGTFQLQIVTPEREVFNAPVESATLPGTEGSFGVLRGHAPLIAALEPGGVEIVDVDGARSTMAIGGGFFQVSDNVAMVLADSAEFAQDINIERAREAESRAQSRISGQGDAGFQLQRDRAEAALKRARVRQRIASGR
ncbi:MAG TPA: ATP synthase F1 subunit epsilon [Abditibacteriaceae bacterium]|jgi:F-type H+-transporting ATPase subunit epsilon